MLNWLSDGKKMTAERREEALSAYLDGELSQRERTDLEGALARDPGLRAELEEMRQVVGMLNRMPQVRLPRSFTLDPAVYGRTKQPWFQFYPALRTATVLATLVFVFLFAGNRLFGAGGTASEPAQEPQVAAMRAAETVVVETEKVIVTEEVEAPASKAASDAMPEEAGAPAVQAVIPTPEAEAEWQGEGVARVMGTEVATAEAAEPAEPPAAAPAAEEAVAEQPEELSGEPTGEAPMAMAAPPTVEGGGESDSSVPVPGTATPAAEPTIEAYGLEAPQAIPEVAPDMAAEEVAPRGAEEMGGGTDWVLIAEIGLGALAAVLLVLTLLARQYSW